MPLYALGPLTPKMPPAGRFWIAPDAHVIGQVELGEDVGVWFGAVLRGDNEPILVGAGSNIQECVMVHVDPGFPVTIGAGCTIGDNSLIVGAPAKAIRILDAAAVEGLRRSARNYVRNWQRFAADLKAL